MIHKFKAKSKETQYPTAKPKETFPQILMNYEVIRDKAQTPFFRKVDPQNQPQPRKNLLIFNLACYLYIESSNGS